MSEDGRNTGGSGAGALGRAWEAVAGRVDELRGRALPGQFASDPERFSRLAVTAAGLTLDPSRQPLDDALLDAFEALFEAAELPATRAALFRPNTLNPTENRAVLHTALRTPSGDPEIDGPVAQALERILTIAGTVRAGRWIGATDRPVHTLVHVGMGGSVLGPRLACEALGTGARGPRVRFVDNIDGHALARVLAEVDPERTLFVIASKSFGTLETREIGLSVRRWYAERGIHGEAFSRHCLAVTANVERAGAFGITENNCLPMWDWVGGRYSVWSAIGLPVAVALGPGAFQDLLAGAAAMDAHFRREPLRRNLPVLWAVTGLLQRNLLGHQAHAVLAYDDRLERLVTYLQQLDMESNGKSVTAAGDPVPLDTAPVLWGGVGTSCQHAFMQCVHQGTITTAVDFLLVREPDHPFRDQHEWLLAHGLSQAEALLSGTHPDPADDPLAAHRRVPGNKASNVLVLDRLTPETLGALLAAYEHRVLVQSLAWGINAFDQWGVELGKVLGDGVREELVGKAEPPPRRALVSRLRR